MKTKRLTTKKHDAKRQVHAHYNAELDEYKEFTGKLPNGGTVLYYGTTLGTFANTNLTSDWKTFSLVDHDVWFNVPDSMSLIVRHKRTA